MYLYLLVRVCEVNNRDRYAFDFNNDVFANLINDRFISVMRYRNHLQFTPIEYSKFSITRVSSWL